jgi:hypothetical protein
MNNKNGEISPSEPHSLMMRINKYRMLLLLSSIWMVSAGNRIMVSPTEIPLSISFNQFFLWEALVLLGTVLFTGTLYGYHKEKILF